MNTSVPGEPSCLHYRFVLPPCPWVSLLCLQSAAAAGGCSLCPAAAHSTGTEGWASCQCSVCCWWQLSSLYSERRPGNRRPHPAPPHTADRTGTASCPPTCPAGRPAEVRGHRADIRLIIKNFIHANMKDMKDSNSGLAGCRFCTGRGLFAHCPISFTKAKLHHILYMNGK